MIQSVVLARTKDICKEFDSRLLSVGVAFARLEIAKALAEREAEIAALQEQIKTLKQEMDETNEFLKNRMNAFDRVTYTRDTLRDKIADLTAQVGALRAKITDQRLALTEAVENERLTATLALRERVLREHEATIARMMADNSTLTSQVTTRTRERDEANALLSGVADAIYDADGCCPLCGLRRDQGHDESCRVGTLLAEIVPNEWEGPNG